MASVLLPILVLSVVTGISAQCPSGTKYDSNFNKCYKYYNTPMPYLAAEQQCNSIGGHLVSISNAFENSNIAALITGPNSTSFFWIGANLLKADSWSWITSDPMSYSNWGPNQPNSELPCAIYSMVDFKWKSITCNNAMNFLCSVDPYAPQPSFCPTVVPQPVSNCSTPSTPIDSHDAVCSPGYSLYSRNLMCYKYSPLQKSFHDANTTCAQDGGMLARATSSDVNEFIAATVGLDCSGTACPFIGLHCNGQTFKYNCTWVDGTTLGSYKNFYYEGFSHETPMTGDHTYAIVTSTHASDRQSGTWQPHNDARAFVCEKPSYKP